MIIILTILLGTATIVSADDDLKVKEAEAAQQALQTMINEIENRPNILGQQLKLFDLASVDELRRLTVGPGYEIYYTSSDKIAVYQGDNFSEMLERSYKWEHILYLDGIPKLTMQVIYNDGKFQLGRYGGNRQPALDMALKQYEDFLKEMNEPYIEPIYVDDGPQSSIHLIAKTETKEWILSTLLKYEPENRLFESKIMTDAYRTIWEEAKNNEPGKVGGNNFNLKEYLKKALADLEPVPKSDSRKLNIGYIIAGLLVVSVLLGVSVIMFRRKP